MPDAIDGDGKILYGGEFNRDNDLDVNYIVLTDGKGSRLGRVKTQVTVGEKTLLQRALCSIRFVKSDVIVVASGKEDLPRLPGYPDYRVVTDTYPDRGPLVGILSGLMASRTVCNLVVACDMPFLNRGWLAYIIQLARGFGVVISRLGKMIEPLHAVYTRICREPMEKLIEAGNFSLLRLLGMVKMRYVDIGEVDNFGPGPLSFLNVNTKADLARAQKLVQREDKWVTGAKAGSGMPVWVAV